MILHVVDASTGERGFELAGGGGRGGWRERRGKKNAERREKIRKKKNSLENFSETFFSRKKLSLSRPRLRLRRDPKRARPLQPGLLVEASRRRPEQSRSVLPFFLFRRGGRGGGGGQKKRSSNRPQGLPSGPGARGADPERGGRRVRGGRAQAEGERRRGGGGRGGRRRGRGGGGGGGGRTNQGEDGLSRFLLLRFPSARRRLDLRGLRPGPRGPTRRPLQRAGLHGGATCPGRSSCFVLSEGGEEEGEGEGGCTRGARGGRREAREGLRGGGA